VHELDALLGRCPKDRLVLVDLDLYPDRFEPHDVLLTHVPTSPIDLTYAQRFFWRQRWGHGPAGGGPTVVPPGLPPHL